MDLMMASLSQLVYNLEAMNEKHVGLCWHTPLSLSSDPSPWAQLVSFQLHSPWIPSPEQQSLGTYIRALTAKAESGGTFHGLLAVDISETERAVWAHEVVQKPHFYS